MSGTKGPAAAVSRLRIAEARTGAAMLGSQTELAQWLGVHRSQVTRLLQGHELQGEPARRLAALGWVVRALAQVYEPAVIPDWLLGINAHLGGRRPLDVLRAGQLGEVIAAVEAARTGSYA